METLAHYLASLRSRLKAPTLSSREIIQAVSDVTGVALAEKDIRINHGTAHLETRPEKRIAILAHQEAILEVLHDRGVKEITAIR